MGDEGEYEETKIRVYKKVHHKDEGGAMSKYITKPISKLVGGGKKETPKEKRLTV